MRTQEPPEAPCKECRKAEQCRLPLSCPRYLDYQQTKLQLIEDQRALRRCNLWRIEYPDLDSTVLRRRKLAEEHPWVKEATERMEQPGIRPYLALADKLITDMHGCKDSASWMKLQELVVTIINGGIAEEINREMEGNELHKEGVA